MSEYGYIGRTAAYYGDYDEDGSIYVPDYWTYGEKLEDFPAGAEVYELTEAGEEHLDHMLWLRGRSEYQRMHSWVKDPTLEEIWDSVTGDAEYSKLVQGGDQ